MSEYVRWARANRRASRAVGEKLPRSLYYDVNTTRLAFVEWAAWRRVWRGVDVPQQLLPVGAIQEDLDAATWGGCRDA